MVVEQREGVDVYVDPCIEYQEPVVPVSHDDDKVKPYEAVVVVPEPCVPSVDMPVGQDKAPGMVGVEGPVPLMAAQLPLPLAFEKLYLAHDVVHASLVLKLTGGRCHLHYYIKLNEHVALLN